MPILTNLGFEARIEGIVRDVLFIPKADYTSTRLSIDAQVIPYNVVPLSRPSRKLKCFLITHRRYTGDEVGSIYIDFFTAGVRLVTCKKLVNIFMVQVP